MSDKFQDIYRIPSARAEWWDYRNDAAYFVTICTAGREHYFGEIVKSAPIEETQLTTSRQEMCLSEIGQIARQNWIEIPKYFPFVKLDAFVVMPNHVHGILVIDKKLGIPGRDAINRVSDTTNENCNIVESDAMNQLDAVNQSGAVDQTGAVNQIDAINRVSTGKPIGGITGKDNPMLGDSLSRVIRWYKGRTTFICHSVHADFAWQTRFHDHIIRDENEFWKIREYILNNPVRWFDDKYNR